MKKEEYKILEQNLEVLNKNSEKYKKTMKIRDVGIDTTNFNEFFDNSFNFKEIKSNYLSNLISFSFLRKVGSLYQWPLLCFGNLIENSIIHGGSTEVSIDIKCYDSEIYKRLYLATKNTNLSEYKSSNSDINDYEGDFNNKILVISTKDNGTGISSETFNKILFSFDTNDTSNNNINNNYFNNSINIKSSCLRLGDSVLVLSKTKDELNIGLISRQLQMKMNNDLILTPLVNYSYKDKKYEFKSQIGLQSENIILNEIRFLFWSIEEIFNYANKIITGTHIFIYNLKQLSSNRQLYNKATNFELYFLTENKDILYNTLIKQNYIRIEDVNKIKLIDVSLREYLNYFLLDYKNVNIKLLNESISNSTINNLEKIINNNFYEQNDLSENITIINDLFNFSKNNIPDKSQINIILFKGELYKGILIKKVDLQIIIDSIKTNFNVELDKNNLEILEENNILVYLNNRLICRVGQNKFGDIPFFIKKQKYWYYNYFGYMELPNNGMYELTSLKSDFKDSSLFSIFFSKLNNFMKKLSSSK